MGLGKASSGLAVCCHGLASFHLLPHPAFFGPGVVAGRHCDNAGFVVPVPLGPGPVLRYGQVVYIRAILDNNDLIVEPGILEGSVVVAGEEGLHPLSDAAAQP